MCANHVRQPGDESSLSISLRLRKGAEMSFRKLNASDLVDKVAEGKKCVNGEEIKVAA
jgi:hypothetical protein